MIGSVIRGNGPALKREQCSDANRYEKDWDGIKRQRRVAMNFVGPAMRVEDDDFCPHRLWISGDGVFIDGLDLVLRRVQESHFAAPQRFAFVCPGFDVFDDLRRTGYPKHLADKICHQQ